MVTEVPDVEMLPLTQLDRIHSDDGDDVLTGTGVEYNARDQAKQPERSIQSNMVVFLLLGDIIGTGVLELPVAMKKLGWVLGTVLILFLSVPNFYTGLLLSRLRACYPSAVHTPPTTSDHHPPPPPPHMPVPPI